MKQIMFFIMTGLLTVTAQAQKVYFIYLQTDTGNPFYIRMHNKVHSSSTAGYLIVPNLVDSTYNFSVGFAGDKSPETKFSVSVNNADRGFLLKQFDDGLGLFDLQSLTVFRSSSANTVASAPVAKKTDEFSQLLSKAADDTTILIAPPVITRQEVAKEEKPKDETKAVVDVKEQKPAENTGEHKTGDKKQENKPEKNEEPKAPVSEPVPQTPVTNKNEEAQPRRDTIATTQPVPNIAEQTRDDQATQPSQPVYRRSVVTRRSESSTTEGFGLVFLDNYNGVVDTIRILIPNSKNPVKSVSEQPSTDRENVSNVVVQPVNTPAPATKLRRSCTSVASENDFRRLRKNMAGEDNDQDMIEEAAKVFRTKCFTTEQLRNLSALFLSSESKYKFFDAAYPHVSDAQNFSSLQSDIKDDYYVRRFKALIGE